MFRQLALAVVLALPIVPAAYADEKPRGNLSVSATASISAAPDLAILTAGVETRGKTAREALDANTTAMNAVFEAVKRLGIEGRDVQTSNFNIGPDFRHGPEGSQQVGFRVSNMVTLRLREIDRVGEALDALVESGANSAGNVQFVVSDADSRLDEARRSAVRKATARGQLYADAAGVELGRILDLREGGAIPGPQPVFARMASDGGAVPVAQGEQELSATVSITWALRDR